MSVGRSDALGTNETTTLADRHLESIQGQRWHGSSNMTLTYQCRTARQDLWMRLYLVVTRIWFWILTMETWGYIPRKWKLWGQATNRFKFLNLSSQNISTKTSDLCQKRFVCVHIRTLEDRGSKWWGSRVQIPPTDIVASSCNHWELIQFLTSAGQE